MEIRGRVVEESGAPVAGALVMGADLAFAETAEDGTFSIRNPELALFFWCSGFYPRAHALRRDAGEIVVVLRAVEMKRATAAGTA